MRMCRAVGGRRGDRSSEILIYSDSDHKLCDHDLIYSTQACQKNFESLTGTLNALTVMVEQKLCFNNGS